jgi:hypothetical protein
MVAVPEPDPACFPDLAGGCPARRRCCRTAKAMQVISACRCRPVQERPSKWPKPSSCWSCWCACSQTQQPLMAPAKGAERGPGQQGAEVVSALAARAPLAQQPHFVARPMAVVRPGLAVANSHAHGREPCRERTLGAVPPGHPTPGQPRRLKGSPLTLARLQGIRSGDRCSTILPNPKQPCLAPLRNRQARIGLPRPAYCTDR